MTNLFDDDQDLVKEIGKSYQKIIETDESDKKQIIEYIQRKGTVKRHEINDMYGHTHGENLLRQLHAEGYTYGFNHIGLNNFLPEHLTESSRLTSVQSMEILMYIILWLDSRRKEADLEDIRDESQEDNWNIDENQLEDGLQFGIDNGYLELRRDIVKITRDGDRFLRAREESYMPEGFDKTGPDVDEVVRMLWNEEIDREQAIRFLTRRGYDKNNADSMINERILGTNESGKDQQQQRPLNEARNDAEEIIEGIEKRFRQYFPRSLFMGRFSTNIMASVEIQIALVESKRQATSNIIENDPMYSIFLIRGYDKEGNENGNIDVERIQGRGVRTKDMNEGKVPFRKTKGNQDRVLKAFDRYFKRLHEAVRQNVGYLNLPDGVSAYDFIADR